MFNNWLSADDFILLYQKGGPIFRRSLGRILLSPGQRATRAAAHVQDPPCHWWDIPAVRRRWNLKVTGDPDRSFRDAFLAAHPAPPGGWRALSLGCGLGDKEREWAQSGAFARLEAWDVSEPRIIAARKEAASQGLDTVLDFRVGNAMRDPLPAGEYDLVLFEQSLHHFAHIRTILTRVLDGLRPGGLLFVNEYVGASRFQWSDSQQRGVNRLLSDLPLRYRRLWGGMGHKTRACRPSKLLMHLNDPSEAADSASIQPALHALCEVLEDRPYGGGILQWLFEGIAHNFLSDDPETPRWLEHCFAVEDALMASGEIPSDFAVLVARKPA